MKLSIILVSYAMSARRNFSKNIVLALSLLATLPIGAKAESYATLQRKDTALGHYARSRAMLVEALAEFEQARKIARPDMLIDPEEWRLSVISRTEELNRILDPKPRVTRGGAVFRANKLLIRRERQRPAAVENGAKDNNVASAGSSQSYRYVKESVKSKIENARASLGDEQEKEISDIVNQPNIDLNVAKQTGVDRELKEEVVKTTTTEKLTEKTSPIRNEEAKQAVQEEIKVESKKVETSTTATLEPLGELPSANKNIVIEEETVSETKISPANEAQQEVKPANEELVAPEKLIVEDDEEVVGRTRQDTGTEAHEDEITRKIEKALEERMRQEQQTGGNNNSVDNEGN